MKNAWISIGSFMIILNISAIAERYGRVDVKQSTILQEGDIYESIHVEDSYSPELGNMAQTVVQVNGGRAGMIWCDDSSRLEIYEGGEGLVTMSADSSLLLNGGTVMQIIGRDNSLIDMQSVTGDPPVLQLWDYSQMNLYDGKLDIFDCHNETVGYLHGGFINIAIVRDFSRFHLYGGEIGDILAAAEFGEIHLYGYDFIYDASLGNYNGGLVSGLWRDDTPFSISLVDHFHEIPEPATLLLLGIGWICLRRGRYSSDSYMPKGIST